MKWLSDLVGAAPARPATRLSEARALEIAALALATSDAPHGAPSLIVRDVISTGDGLVWVIDTATRGSGTSVSVSDADERIIAIQRRSSR